MKVTIYELLGMVKDDKAPKNARIRYFDRHNDYYDECNLKENEIINRLHYGNIELNDEVEIIEEPQEHKIPEKFEIYDNSIEWCCNNRSITDNEKDIMDKINKILDYLEEIE